MNGRSQYDHDADFQHDTPQGDPPEEEPVWTDYALIDSCVEVLKGGKRPDILDAALRDWHESEPFRQANSTVKLRETAWLILCLWDAMDRTPRRAAMVKLLAKADAWLEVEVERQAADLTARAPLVVRSKERPA